ncbi:MAG: PQQ-binding-like beta-propeller repeat protein [Chloroflexi bacterium]|nr:PQQ-binding-like beta-propeller repeat protein [Chloroflexota bacterium]
MVRKITLGLLLCSLLAACATNVVPVETHTLTAPVTPTATTSPVTISPWPATLTPTPPPTDTPQPTLPSIPLSVADAQGAQVEVVGYIERRAQSVFVRGDHAYVGFGPELAVLDVSDPTRPEQTSTVTLPTDGDVVDVYAASNGYAYATAAEIGLRAVDISSFTAPVEIGFFSTPETSAHVVVAGRYAYVAAGDSGLWAIDVSNPAIPFEAGSYDTPGYAWDVAVAGDYAYVADRDSGLRVVNVSDPADPIEVGVYDAPGAVNSVVVADGYVYVADWVGGLRVLDISDPTDPVEVGSYHTQHAWSVAVQGRYAYVADTYDGLRVMDVSDPSYPIEVGFYETAGAANDVAVADEYVYVAGEGGLFILRFAPPADVARPAPTPTAPVVNTSILAPAPTPTPMPCPVVIASSFYYRLKMYPDVRAALGCPIDWQQQTWVAEERFQYGRMFWQKDTDMIHVLYRSSSTFQLTPNMYFEGDPEDACPTAGNAPAGLFKPGRGFNRQWCNIAIAKSLLGWATEEEVGYNTVWQKFEHGHMLLNRWNQLFVFHDDGTWNRY